MYARGFVAVMSVTAAAANSDGADQGTTENMNEQNQDERQQSAVAARAEAALAARRAAQISAAVNNTTLQEVQSGEFESRTGIKLTGRELFENFPDIGDGL